MLLSGVYILFQIFFIIGYYKILHTTACAVCFPGGSEVKNLPANAGATGDMGSILGSRRSPAVGSGNPLQYYCRHNPMDKGAWQAIVRGTAKESDMT